MVGEYTDGALKINLTAGYRFSKGQGFLGRFDSSLAERVLATQLVGEHLRIFGCWSYLYDLFLMRISFRASMFVSGVCGCFFIAVHFLASLFFFTVLCPINIVQTEVRLFR